MKKAISVGTYFVDDFLNERTVTASLWSTFCRCRKSFEFQYIYRLARRTGAIHFFIGGLFHQLLGLLYGQLSAKKYNKENFLKICFTTIDKATNNLCKQPGLTDRELQKITIAAAGLKGIMTGYVDWWSKDNNWNVTTIEQGFKIKIPASENFSKLGKWFYAGKIDLQAQINKAHTLVEHKSTGKLDSAYIARLPLDNQVQGYLWASRHAENLKPATAILYNVAQKSGFKLRQGETLETLTVRILEDYKLNPSKYFYRERLDVLNKLTAFENDLQIITSEIERCVKERAFYKNTSMCTMMGECSFMPICLDGGLNQNNSLLYRVKERTHEELEDE